MPWIEPASGDVSHGVGGGFASLNNVAFSVGGVGGWCDQNRVAFANGNDGWLVSTYDKVTKQIERVLFDLEGSQNLVINAVPGALRAYSRSMRRVYDDALAAGHSLVPTPANVIYAGGGHVACWFAGDGPDRGVYSTLGLRLPDAGLMGMGPEAEVGYKPLYQSYGPTHVREANGDDWMLTPGHAAFLTMYGARRNMWQEGFVVNVTNLPQPQVFFDNGGGVWAPSAAFVAGEWWLAYYSSAKGIILHPFRSYERVFSILPVGDGWHRISAFGQNVVRIAISVGEGEQPGQIWGYDIDVTTGQATTLPFWNGGQPKTFPFMKIGDVNPPAAPTIPTFSFNHKVTTVVFKDPDAATSAPAEILVNKNRQSATRPVFVAEDSLIAGNWKGPLAGVYTEAKGDKLADVVKLAASMKTRVLACHDSIDPWTLPAGLRAWDVVAIETYRYPTESLGDAVARWKRDAAAMLAGWPNACAIVPMYYCMGGVPGGQPPEVWPVADVLDTQRRLSELVNLSPRIKVVAPFSYLRANGIVAHVELQQSYANLLAAASSPLDLMPVPPDVDPPKPQEPYHRAKEYQPMSGEIGAIKGPGNKFGRIVEADKGKGMFGWYPVRFDRDSPDDDCWFELTKPDSRHQLLHTKVPALLGADSTEHSGDIPKQFYGKPTSIENARGILESPVVIYDPASSLIIGYFTWPDKGVGSPSFVWVKRS